LFCKTYNSHLSTLNLHEERRPAIFDLAILGGTVVDGTGAPGRKADVAIQGDRIARIGRVKKGEAVRDFSATGAVVAPASGPTPPPPTVPEAHTRGSLVEIVCPMVGVFYEASAPDADPFVKLGDEVEPETVVCIIEAMKVMNEIKAETSGRVADVLVSNGEAVEFGQVLFLVEPAGE